MVVVKPHSPLADAGALAARLRYLAPVSVSRLALLALLALGCDAEAPAGSSTRDEPAAPEVLDDGEDALDPPPSSAWPSEVRSLRDAVRGFTSVDACLEELRARTPTAVSEGIADVGYDGFFDDVCRGLEAARDGDVEACDALEISTARAGCRRRLALVHGRADACPEDRVIPGREAVCVAWAARDPGLCRASAEPVRCRAVLAGDADACRTLRAGDRERCRAHVARYASALEGERRDSPATREAAVMTLEVREEGGAPIALSRDVLERGVRVSPRGCDYVVPLANALGELTVPVGLEREEPSFHLELSVPGGAREPITLALGADRAVLSLRTPAHGGVTSLSGARGVVTLERFEAALGGAITGTIEGTLRHADTELSVRGRFATFVRDLDALPERCREAGGSEGEGG